MRVAGTLGRLKSLPLVETTGLQQGRDEDHIETGILAAAACGGALGVLYIIVLAIFITSRMKKKRMIKNLATSHSVEEGDVNRSGLGGEAGKTADGSINQATTQDYNASLYSAWPEDVSGSEK